MSSRVQPGMSEHKGIADRLKTLERQVARLARARTMQSTSLDGGTFRVKNGGKIQLVNDAGDVVAELDKDSQTFFDASGNPLTVLDGTGLSVGDAPVVIDKDGLDIGSGLVEVDSTGVTVGTAPVVLDNSGLDVGSGLTVIDSTGVQVGSDVVIDSTGLKINGGDTRAIDHDIASNSTSTATLTTTMSDLVSTTLDVPSWATSALVQIIATVQSGNDGAGMGVIVEPEIGGVTGDTQQHDVPTGETISVAAFQTRIVSSPGSTVTITCRGQRNGGDQDQTGVRARIHGTLVALR